MCKLTLPKGDKMYAKKYNIQNACLMLNESGELIKLFRKRYSNTTDMYLSGVNPLILWIDFLGRESNKDSKQYVGVSTLKGGRWVYNCGVVLDSYAEFLPNIKRSYIPKAEYNDIDVKGKIYSDVSNLFTNVMTNIKNENIEDIKFVEIYDSYFFETAINMIGRGYSTIEILDIYDNRNIYPFVKLYCNYSDTKEEIVL